jgi:LacI family transcriptional regulator
MAQQHLQTSRKTSADGRPARAENLTLSDVAVAAGVTLATASRSINGTYGVHPETRKRVLEAAAQLNYKPNRVARGLATGRSNSIGLIVTDIRNSFFAEVARGAEDAAYAADCNVILCNSDLDSSKEMRYFDAFLEKRVDGIIMNSVTSLTPSEQAYIAARGVPVVLLNRPTGPIGVSTITAKNRHGGELAAAHLLSAGHRHFVHLTGPKLHHNFSKRAAGFKEAITRFGQGATVSVMNGAQSLAGGYEMAAALFRNLGLTTAIFTGNDSIALGVIKAAGEVGVRIPEDVSLVGFDDIEIAALTYPALTTIRQPKYEVGRMAVEMLLRSNNQDTLAVEHKLLDVDLIERSSVAEVPARPKKG